MFNKIKNSKLFQVLGLSWLICIISHVIIPTFIAFPIFNYFFDHSHGHEYGVLVEMIIFAVIIVPTSLIVTFIQSRISKKKHCCDHVEQSLPCETCPHKEDAFEYVHKLEQEARDLLKR